MQTINWRGTMVRLFLAALAGTEACANWDGEASLDDIDLNMESFIDISSYQFRPAEVVAWYDVENGARIAAGSLETDYLYLFSDLRLKQAITPNLIFRLQLQDEEFYEPREFPRPLLELELRPTERPLSVSLIGTPAYAKREADLGVAATLGERPWNFFRVAWLKEDDYFNDKNDLDEAYYRRKPSQLTLEGAYRWADRYKLRVLWQDNNPLEFGLDDQISVFAYENRDYRISFDYRAGPEQDYGVIVRGFETQQSLAESDASRSQDIRYFALDGYWIRKLGARDEWTLGLRYDDFVNRERTLDAATSFDFTKLTAQVYSTYYHPFSAHQAWELELHLGLARQEYDYLAASVPDEEEDRIEAKLRSAWELFSLDRSTALTLGVSLNLDELINDPFDGGSVRFRTQF